MGGRDTEVVLLDADGIRCDGRRVDEPRRIEIRAGVLKNADGSAYSGSQTASVPFTTNDQDFDHVLPNAARGSVWNFQIRSTNRNGDHSPYATLEIHATEQAGYLTLDHRFLRVRATSTSYRRLRLE